MQKFLAVVKHEYKKIVLKWTFLIGTLLFPLLAAGFAVVPAIIFSIKGEPTQIVVADRKGKIAPRLKANLSAEKMREKAIRAAEQTVKEIPASQEEKMKRDLAQFEESFSFVDYDAGEKNIEQIEQELGAKIRDGELDAYLIVPENYADENAVYEFFSRKSGDFIINSTLRDALNDAVRAQRLADANISEDRLKQFTGSVKWNVTKLDETGTKTESDAGFWAGFIIAFMIYLNLAIYGQMIMSTVVEEKETRVAEILFSSARPFELMMGKLVGVGLAGLTQFAIWVISAALLVAFILASGFDLPLPVITILDIIYFLIYFLLGFFLYASIFALIGSMVTSVQEGGQFAFLPVMLMLAGFYFSFAVIRDPNSTLSVWASIAPFIAPMTMPIRILSEMPPLWQIALSIFVNLAAITGLIWVASRVYRVGMLMYGKRATIPEVWKWIRQS